jgi:hypothetical protein
MTTRCTSGWHGGGDEGEKVYITIERDFQFKFSKRSRIPTLSYQICAERNLLWNFNLAVGNVAFTALQAVNLVRV